MLDQADFIARLDKANALGVIAALPDQLRYKFDQPELSHLTDIRSIVIAGMGGSAQGAEFIKTWLGDRLPLPLVIVRDYDLPAFVDETTLVVASSYSGNTEESIAALQVAEERHAKIVVISSGGKLLAEAEAKGHPLFHYELPEGYQPRMAVLYDVRALAQMIEGLGLLKGIVDELAAVATWLADQTGDWGPTTNTDQNQAKQIATALVGHVAVVYAGPTLAFAAMKWKIAFNENAKNLAFYNYFPELNHNEFIGWSHPERSGLKVIELRSDKDHPQVQKRFDITNKLLSSAFSPIEVQAKGEDKLQQLVWTITLGEYVATYLAFLNGIDPSPVELVEKLKAELA